MSQPSAVLHRRFTQTDFDRFATLSGDHNPIHVDPAFSAGTRFGRTVAHGLLLCSVLRGLVEQIAPGARLEDQAVMFPAPSYADEALQFLAEQVAEQDGVTTIRLEVRRQGDEEITCTGQCRVRS